MMDAKPRDQLIEHEAQFCAQNYAPLPVVLTRGAGCYLWDTEGRRYLDMMSAYSAVSHGHCHPRLVQALTLQAQQLAIVSRAFYTEKLAQFLQRACDVKKLCLRPIDPKNWVGRRPLFFEAKSPY